MRSVLSCALPFLYAIEAQFINVPVQKTSDPQSSLRKRQFTNITLEPTDQSNAYVANISFGTPAQVVSLILDTGSPLTWVNAQNLSTFTPGSTPTKAQQAQGSTICQSESCLNPSRSSTLRVPSNSTVFDIQYVDGTSSVGRTVEDTVSFQGLTDSTFEFGLVEYFYSPQGVAGALGGILGLSPPAGVLKFNSIAQALNASTSSSASIDSFTPVTILDQLRNAGAIASTAFSLYLSSETEGQLTIGGVDTGRYTGALTVLGIEADPESTDASFYVNLDALGHGGGTSDRQTVNQLVVLDSGTTSMYLPASIVEQLANNLKGYFVPYSSSSGLLAIPCSTSTTIDFYFDNNSIIKVPTSAILQSRLTSTQARRYGITASSDVCVLNLFGTADSDAYLLGDSFLRSAYVVYDLQQNQIAIAQAAYDGTSNISPISNGLFGIPGGVYNSSSPQATNVAVIPSVTRTLSAASNAVPRSTATGTIRFTASTSTTTRQTTTPTTGATATGTSTSTSRSSAESVHSLGSGFWIMSSICAMLFGSFLFY